MTTHCTQCHRAFTTARFSPVQRAFFHPDTCKDCAHQLSQPPDPAVAAPLGQNDGTAAGSFGKEGK